MKHIILSIILSMLTTTSNADRNLDFLPEVPLDLASTIDIDAIHRMERDLGINKWDACLFDPDGCLPDPTAARSKYQLPSIRIDQINQINFDRIHKMEKALGLDKFEICYIFPPACSLKNEPVN